MLELKRVDIDQVMTEMDEAEEGKGDRLQLSLIEFGDTDKRHDALTFIGYAMDGIHKAIAVISHPSKGRTAIEANVVPNIKMCINRLLAEEDIEYIRAISECAKALINVKNAFDFLEPDNPHTCTEAQAKITTALVNLEKATNHV